jgi:hypothetical protein
MYNILFNDNKIFKNKNFNKKSLNFYFLFNFFFYRNIQIFFFKKTNKIFLQEKNLIIRIFFVNLFFFKNLSVNYLNINFLFIELKKYFSFFKNIWNVYNTIKNLYFFRLKLRGLGFVLKRYSKFLFSFLMAVNHFYYFFVPDFVFLKKKKKHIICLSIDNIRLNILFWHLLFIKKHNVYVRTKKLNGFIKNNFIRFIRKKYKL